jgi:Tfp pilus assembly protein PilO
MNLPYWSKLNGKNKSIFVILIILLINISIIYFVVWPTIDNIEKLNKNILQNIIDTENQTAQNQQAGELNNKLKKIEPQINRINTIFISKNRELEFINALDAIASTSSYKITQITSIDFKNPQKQDGFNKVSISIDASGDFDSLVKYFLALESMNYYINIESVSFYSNYSNKNIIISDNQQVSEDNLVNLKITGYSFWK